VEGEDMTDDELEQEIQNLGEAIDKLAKAEGPLTKQEKRRRHILPLKKDILQRMQQAREKKDRNQELKCSMDYALLEEFGERHPILLHLARIKLRGHIL